MLLLLGLAGTAAAQQPDPFGARRSGTAVSSGEATSEPEPALVPAVDERLKGRDSVVYRLARSSRLQVKTGKAGLFGFAGHTHVIEARGFTGEVVYYPGRPSSSHLDITVRTDSLEVLTPPDTAEMRKVTESMRSRVLRTAEYPEITLVSRQVAPSADGFHILGAMTLVGQTREVPIDVVARIGLDTLEAVSTFAIKQTDFGITPFSGGPGGSVKVADRVTFDIRAVAVRVEEAQAHAERDGGAHASRSY
ncbi:MAG TPA: YceI family protein [Gemmatimonadales bacterium]|nr:YceI family protein [Gemmatimonadales bacterium]